jgi:glutaredoxin
MTQMIIELTFYTTEGCHLCEDAQRLLQQLLVQYPTRFQIEVVDIIDSEELVEQYGTRIPVVMKDAVQQVLAWPFTYADLLCFVEEGEMQ